MMSTKRKLLSEATSEKIFEVEDDYLISIDKNEENDAADDDDSDYADMSEEEEDESGDSEEESADDEESDNEEVKDEIKHSDDEGNESKGDDENSESEAVSSDGDENSESEAESNDGEVEDHKAHQNTINKSLSNRTQKGENQTNSKKIVNKGKNSVSSAARIKQMNTGAADIAEVDEYEQDSSDEEDLRNTIGNVPINWYDEYPHIGYDLDGNPIIKPKRGDTLDAFLARHENPDNDRTIFDKQTGQDVRLSDGDLDVVERVMGHKVPDGSYDYYAPWIDFFTHEVMEMPLSGRPEHKRSFIPSLSDKKMVAKMVHKIKMGYLKPRPKKPNRWEFNYDLWKSDHEALKLQGHIHNPLPAPKQRNPGHTESYRPPVEFLFTDHQLEKWKKRQQRALDDPDFHILDYNYVPTIFKSVRQVPAYQRFIKERFERCLDLYLAPRKKIFRCVAKPQDLLPVLPRPRDLRPFPTREELVFRGHRSIIRTISVHPFGRYLASGSDDHTVKIWEISTGRCIKSFDVEGAVKSVAWNPHKDLFLLAIVFDSTLVLLNPESYLVDKLVVQKTNSAFQAEPEQGDYIVPDRVSAAVTWRKATAEEWSKGYRCILTFFKELKEVVWHRQGDYFATVIPEGQHRSVLMHQLSRWRSQLPFNKPKGRVQAISFHPKLPYLYVCTQSHIRVYHLQKQELLKKVQSNSRYISSIAVHPGGEHFLIGTYDKRVTWFEMEYTRRPLILRYHHDAVRKVAYHRKYPLFASASDDARVIVAHGMVYNDLLKDPLLVPVKELMGHSKFDDYCVLDLVWHPYQPFLMTAGADATIRLWH